MDINGQIGEVNKTLDENVPKKFLPIVKVLWTAVTVLVLALIYVIGFSKNRYESEIATLREEKKTYQEAENTYRLRIKNCNEANAVVYHLLDSVQKKQIQDNYKFNLQIYSIKKMFNSVQANTKVGKSKIDKMNETFDKILKTTEYGD